MRRDIQRLCHFTSSANFLHVLQSGLLKDRKTLDSEQNVVVNPTDEMRFDGHREAICCSVEYPNTYYLDVAVKKQVLFEGWIILFLKPDLLWSPHTLFCEKNAAAANGALIMRGEKGYRSMFPSSARGYARKATQLLCSPTDLQAEVLIPGPILLNQVIGMAMRSEEQVQTELVRWETVGIQRPEIPIFVAPSLYSKTDLRDRIWQGRRPDEIFYEK
jgi:hypothetical protein